MMNAPRDAFGLGINVGDVVAATRTNDTKLMGVDGVVVRARCDDLIGVQLARRLLPYSAHPEVLYTAPDVWSVMVRTRGFEA
jgi:hypothetical protein